MNPDDKDLIRRRQRDNARVTALILGGFVILVFAITIAKMAFAE
jgi:hypothetical protein